MADLAAEEFRSPIVAAREEGGGGPGSTGKQGTPPANPPPPGFRSRRTRPGGRSGDMKRLVD